MPDAFMPDVFVEVAWNAGYTTAATARRWTDVSDYVELADGIEIGFGRQDERSTADANSLTLTLDNSDGRFTAGRSASPYYPDVKIGRPVRVSAVMPGASSLGPANPGAEVNTSGWATLGGGSLARSTTRAQSGVASFLRTWPTAAAEAASTYAAVTGLTVGEWYRFEGYVWVPAGSPRAMLKCLEWKSLPSSTSAAWERLHVTFQATATSHNIEVKNADASTAGQTLYFDTLTAKLTTIRFVGFVDEWPVEWDGTDTYARASITAASRLSRLGLGAKLKTAIEQEVLAPGPFAYWKLNDSSGSTTAQESSGRNVAPALTYWDTTGWAGPFNAPVFGNATGVASDGMTALEMPANCIPLVAQFPVTTVRSVRLTFLAETAGTGGFFLLLTSPSGVTFPSYATLAYDDTTSAVYDFSNSGLTGPASSAPQGVLHDLVITWTSADANRMYIDGALVDTDTGQDKSISGIKLGQINQDQAYTFCHLALYDVVLTPTQIAAQAEAALTGFAGDRTDERVVRLLGWAGVPSTEVTVETGVETMTYQLTGGQSVVDALRECESTEGGVLFDGRDGNVTFHNRSHRYTQAPAVALDMASQHVEQDYRPRVDRSTLVNEVEVENPTTEEKLRLVDATSADEYGPSTTTITSVAETADDFLERAQWILSSYAEPRTRAPSLTVDVLAHQGLTPSAQDLLALTIGDLVEVENAPAQSDTTTPAYFIEGGAETIGPESYRITFNVSPASPAVDVLILDSATRGLLDTNLAAY